MVDLPTGTLEQNKMGDVVTENTQEHKRTSSESFSSRNKDHRALFRDEKIWKKSFVFDVVISRTTSPYLTPPYSTGELTCDPVPALYGKTLLNGTRTPIRYSWVGPGQPGGVWGGNPIEKAGLAGIGCRGQLPQYLSAGYFPHMCGNVLSSRIEKSRSKVGPMRTEKW